MTRAAWMRTGITAIALALLLAAGMGILTYSRWGRFARGISTLVVANQSGVPLEDVRISFVPAGSVPTSQAFETIAAGESRTIAVRTSDLVVDRLHYTLKGQAFTYDKGGIACPGERFVLSITGPGSVTTNYAP